MPIRALKLRATGVVIYRRNCEVCGSDIAPFGQGVRMREAAAARAAGDKEAYRQHMGRWFCRDHWPGRQAAKPKAEQGDLF